MDIVGASTDFQDWEVLFSDSDPESTHVVDNSAGFRNSLDEIDSGGGIHVDYFSLEAQNRRYVEDLEDGKSAGSDNPSWIDPGLEENPNRYLYKESGEFWSDSSSERSEDRKVSDLVGSNEMGLPLEGIKEVGFEEIGGKNGEKIGDLGKFSSGESGNEVGSVKCDDTVKGFEIGELSSVNMPNESVCGEEKIENEKIANEGEGLDDNGNKRGDEIGKRGVVWWKMPMVFLKYCVFGMSPVWTVSVAAAVMGLMILGRRLYKMKRKARGLEIKVTVDDKVSQVMSRAARLNEAFSVVKRVPVIRPSLPAAGVSTWPVMSLR